MIERAWVSTGQVAQVEGFESRIPDYDPRSGEHLWVVLNLYRVDPTAYADPTRTPMLDLENLISVEGPGCYHCEQPYTPRLASRRCPGEPR